MTENEKKLLEKIEELSDSAKINTLGHLLALNVSIRNNLLSFVRKDEWYPRMEEDKRTSEVLDVICNLILSSLEHGEIFRWENDEIAEVEEDVVEGLI